MDLKKSIILTEFPAPCNMKCEYCYINPNNSRRRPPFKKVTYKDFIKLAESIPVEDVCFHFCSIGEPILYPYSVDIFDELLKEYPVVINTNMISNRLDQLLDSDVTNLALWWSIHWNELKRLDRLDKVLSRIKKFKDAGATVWPMMVAYPSYLNQINNILKVAEENNFVIKLMHYRDLNNNGTGKHGLVPLSLEMFNRLTGSPYIDFSHWNESFNRWEVKGGQCSSGVNFLVVNSKWNIVSCGGSGSIKFGTFPEDLDKITFREKGTCESDLCPCSWAIFHGVNSKHRRSMSNVLYSNKGALKNFYGI